MSETASSWRLGKPPTIIVVIYALALTAYTAVSKIEGPTPVVNQVRINSVRISVLESEFSAIKAQMLYNRDENRDDHIRILNKIDVLLQDTRELKRTR